MHQARGEANSKFWKAEEYFLFIWNITWWLLFIKTSEIFGKSFNDITTILEIFVVELKWWTF